MDLFHGLFRSRGDEVLGLEQDCVQLYVVRSVNDARLTLLATTRSIRSNSWIKEIIMICLRAES
jgi:hypothetical protein